MNSSREALGQSSVWAALAAALATLLCCVIPSLLVLAGLGMMVAAVTSAAPWLVSMSRHKDWVFLAAAALIVLSRWYSTRIAPRAVTEGATCPPVLGRWTGRAWWLSVVLFGVGALTVYVLGPLLLRFGG